MICNEKTAVTYVVSPKENQSYYKMLSDDLSESILLCIS